MATMNSRRGMFKKDTQTTVNHHGVTVHELNSLEVLFSKVLGSLFGESTHYEKRSAESDFKELCKVIEKVDYEDIEYILKIALLGRKYNMIQYPLSVLTACMNDERFKGVNFIDEKTGRNKLQTYSKSIIKRGRDITDILAIQMNGFTDNRPIPMQMRKVLRNRLENFSEYQLSKALGEKRQVSMADAIKLLHPNAKKFGNEEFYKNVIENNVKMGANTKQIQSELAKVNNKNSNATKDDIVKSLDTSTVMAIVKNLVAIYRQGLFDDEKVVVSIAEKLVDRKLIWQSKLLPFRFYSAFKEVNRLPNSKGKQLILDGLERALDLSIDNLKTIDGYSAILVDMSGSMDVTISSMSKVTAKEVACILGAICFKKGIADVYCFASDCQQISGMTRHSTVIDIVDRMMSINVGGCTNLDIALKTIRDSGAKYDNLIILSDNDCYRSTLDNGFKLRGYYYSQDCDSDVNALIKKGVMKKVFVNNLLGNNFAIVNTDDYRKNLITGFSERIVDVINTYSALGTGASDIRVVIDSLVESLHK